MVIDHLDGAIPAFNQGRTGFDPVATVIISDVAELVNRRAVNVPAEHRVHSISLGVMDDSLLKFSDETDSVFDPLFGVGAERPVAETEPPAEKIDRRIEREQKLVAEIA